MKKLIPVILVCAIILAFAAMPAVAADDNAKGNEIFIGVWSADLQGSVKSGTTSINVKDDLGFSTKSTLYAGAKFDLSKKWNLSLGYYDLSYSASSRINKAINFEGKTYPANDVIDGEQKFSVLEGMLGYKLMQTDDSFLSLIFGIKSMSVKTKLSSASQGATEYSITAPVPEIGFAGQTAMGDKVDFYGEIRGMSVHTGGVTGSTLDYDFGLKFDVGNNGGLKFGYKYSKLNAKKDDQNQEGDLSYFGPHLDLMFRF
ncbi:MAG: hypothetical protein M1269_05300 [Chloroflexi bacterium]|nr:hypothetical protein [Chloroflexota bacterium]